jgi:hypothetical protein
VTAPIPVPPEVRAAEKTLAVGTWLIVGGAVLYSVLTVTPLAAAHTPHAWRWTAPILPVVVDAAVVIVVRLDAVLARLGGRGGAWPVVLRWMTGLATLALNTGTAALTGDLVGVAVHAVAPLLLIVTAETSLAYRRAINRTLARLADEHAERAARDRAEREAREQRVRAERERERQTAIAAEREQYEAGQRAERERRAWEAQQERERFEHEERMAREARDAVAARERAEQERRAREADEQERAEAARRARKATAPAAPPRKRPTTTRTAPRPFDVLLAEAREVTADWPAERITAEELRTTLRCGAIPARQVRDALTADRATAPGGDTSSAGGSSTPAPPDGEGGAVVDLGKARARRESPDSAPDPAHPKSADSVSDFGRSGSADFPPDFDRPESPDSGPDFDRKEPV